MHLGTRHIWLNGWSGKEVRRDNSQKQGLLGAMMERSFGSELKRIRVLKTIRFGGSFFGCGEERI
jgi:hypothetical protein